MDRVFSIESISNYIKVIQKPFLISGPCSAESFDQLYNTALALKNLNNISVFRAGLWKPRTRPNSFNGVGDVGLEWLQRIKAETGLLTAVEVATPIHVEKCLNFNIDILWIGARTTVNPFSIQEIADSLKGVDKIVMIKNPINPDIELWIGAIERIYSVGINKIIAIHRGFNTYGKSFYRNEPIWEIPIELKRKLPNLPIICDPSHICGNRSNLLAVSQRAIDLEMDGLMIESHISPREALTDARQQLTPNQLNDLLNKLVIRNYDIENAALHNQLQSLRDKIDSLDNELLYILSKRMKIVEEIGNYKKINKVTILQIKRWSEIVNLYLQKGSNLGVDKDFLFKFLELLHKESIKIQTEIMNNKFL